NYNASELQTLLQRLIFLLKQKIAFVEKVRPATKEAFSAYMNELLLITALHLYRVSLFFKHSAFAHEAEYRFLSLFRGDEPPPEMKLRQRGDTTIRFRELNWRLLAPSSLRSVRIGPAADHDGAKTNIKKLLSDSGLCHVPIIKSTVPFRT